MNTPVSYRVRRATTDDLDKLIEVWKAAALPSEQLEKQFTDFQVAETADGRIVGAIALRVSARRRPLPCQTCPGSWHRTRASARGQGSSRWRSARSPS